MTTPASIPELRPHQRKALDTAQEHLRQHARVTICLPCGTGKTLTGQRLAQQVACHGRSAILVLVPSIPLLKQTMESWTAHSARPIEAFVFCHDRKISTAEFQVPVATRPEVLAEWMRRTVQSSRPTDPQAVVFATYHSSPKIAAAHRDHGLAPFHVTVADEAHRAAGELGAAFATVVDDTKIHSAVRIFLTATLRVRRDDNSTALCMENEAAFGPVIAPLGVREAIDQGLLSDYEIAIVTVTNDQIRDAMHARGDTAPQPQCAGEQLAAVQVAVGAARAAYGLSRMMVFHNRVAISRDFTSGLADVVGTGPGSGLIAMHVDGTTSTTSRQKYLDKLEHPGDEKWAVLSSVRCLGEGIDVPSLDGIVFAAPRTSTIDITQCVGRALRLAPDRPGRAVIVLPVFADDRGDLTQQVAGSGYKHVYRTLIALADQDSALAGELAGTPARGTAGRARGNRARGGQPRIKVLTADGAPAMDELRAAIQLRTLQILTPGWDYGYQRLLEYVDAHGDCAFTNSYITDDGYPLGAWARGQRQRRDNLTDEHREKLQSVPGWTWNRFESAWMESYQRFVQWSTKHGHVKVPRGYRTSDGFCMGQWPSIQRREYRAGTLDQRRVELLEALPGWSWEPGRSGWDIGYSHLEEFISDVGSASPSQTYVTASGYRLGFWVAAQRQSYQRHLLSPERIAALEALAGWTWSVREARWQSGLAELLRYRVEHGHLHVPQNYLTPSGDRLGVWVSNQRVAKRSGQLSPERVRALEALDGWSWWAYTARMDALVS
ncbi:DEAD/DEAH box helicase [Mycobacteroides immunogenum]|uniref:DEAD/DEAH box helicase n=1 Tax=Mycobacteroides immunogenum TaxID=83262 RepID=UPI0009BD55E9|nr:DEAD/DEAH box helicase [Mycobacteroides immunogenum]